MKTLIKWDRMVITPNRIIFKDGIKEIYNIPVEWSQRNGDTVTLTGIEGTFDLDKMCSTNHSGWNI